jgi:hypothetical protein
MGTDPGVETGLRVETEPLAGTVRRASREQR